MIAVLCFAFAFAATAAYGALTLSATTVSSDGALTLDGAAASNVNLGAATTSGVIAIGVANTGGINIGAGNTAKTINLGTGTAIDTINIGTGATGVDVITIGSTTATLTLKGQSAAENEVGIAATRVTGATGSFQPVWGDLTYQGAAGGTSTYHAGVMGNFMGAALTNTNATIHAGTIGKYSVTTSDALVGPKAGLVGEAETSVANAAVLAVLGGDTGTVTPGAAYAVRYLNSTAASKFAYGLDLFSAAVGSYKAVDYGTADIRLQNGETISNATDGAITISGALTGSPATLTTTTASGGSNLKLQYKQGTNALTGDYEGLHVRTSTDVGSAANAVNGAQIKAVANDVASQLTVATLRGVYTSVDPKDNLVTTARAFEASLDGSAGSTVTEMTGLEVMNNSSGTQTAAYGVSINGGTPSGHVAFTADFRLQNGETISNATNGTIAFGTANLTNSGTVTVTSTNASALTVGANGATNPVLKVDDSTASVATGLSITGAAAGSGVALASISSGTDEKLTISSKGRSVITLNSRTDNTATGDFIGVQIKPGQGTSKTSGNVIGAEISPRLNSGVALAASGSIIGAHIDTYLKGTAVGTVNGDVRGLQIELVTDDAGTRTIDGDVTGLRFRSAFSATGITGNFQAIKIEKPETQTGSQTYDSVLTLTSTIPLVWNSAPATEPSTADGYIKVIVNGAVRYIQLYSGAPVD